MRRWDLVIFDNDGVLVDSEPLANRILAELLTGYGYSVTTEECIRRFMGGTLERVRSEVEPALGKTLPADFEDRYYEILFGAFATDLEPVAGAAGLLDQLQQEQQPFCLASSGTHNRIRLALATTGLQQFFPDDRVFSAEDVAHGKPEPDLFLLAASRLEAEPSRCVVVEDSPAGVQAARAARMSVVGFAALTPAERLTDAGADLVITAMAQLPAGLEELARQSRR